MGKSAFLKDIKGKAPKKKLKKSKGKKKKSGKGKKKKKPKAAAADDDDEKFDPNKKKYDNTPEGQKRAKKAFGKVVASSSYQEQVEFFMNAMWNEFFGKKNRKVSVDVYECIGTFEELAQTAGGGKQNANDLDEWSASRFFEGQEKNNKIVCAATMTREARLAAFKDIDIDGNKRYSLLEVLVWHFKVKLVDLMNKPQGTNEQLKIAEKALKAALDIIGEIEASKAEKQAIIDAAKDPANKISTVKSSKAAAELAQLKSKDNLPLNKQLITAEAALNKANAALEQANDAMVASKKAADECKAAQDAAEEALAAQKAAEEEVRAGLAKIQAEEAKKAAKIAKYKKIAEDDSLGTVKRGKAFQQMKKVEGEDPLPLRKAKLEQQAKVRKAKRASKIAAKRAKKATEAAEKAAAAATQAEAAFEEASATVQKLASSLGGAGEGTLWWMDRELEEAAQFLPKSKQRALRKKMAAAKKALLAGESAPAATKKKKKKRGKKKSGGDTSRAELGVEIKYKPKLKKTGRKKKGGAGARAKMQLEITKKDQGLKHVDAPESGPSDAIKEAFIEDQKAAAAEESDDE